ncbi:hypothetical protein [Rhizobium sp. BK008]|uniref:hypothetical protein n=1 Tax=Rhizobium sp. BK008 TaxID=2587094 RepID=UPI0016212FDB|nr:hypothetical protein [Rhizobium sp. BK008]MBB4250866.1 hypothetical protein [Rhizobium sp. BK008]
MGTTTIWQRLVREIDWRDWRVRWVLGSTAVTTIITIAIYYLNEDATNLTTFWGSFYTNWASGLALTIAVTLIVTIAQFARPDQEVFEARARNLLRKQTGPHIDYIIPKIQKLLVPYCEFVEREMVIAEFDKPTNLLRINQRTHNELKSYLNDMPVTFSTKLAYENGTAAPPGRDFCSLSYLKVDGKLIGGAEDFETSISRPFNMEIIPHNKCEIDHRMVFWIEAGVEPNRHFPVRFTRRLAVKVANQLQSSGIVAKFTHPHVHDVKIGPGESVLILELLDLVPPSKENGEPPVYEFTLEVT